MCYFQVAEPVCLGSPVTVSLCGSPVGGGSVGGFGSCPGLRQPHVPHGARGAGWARAVGVPLPFPAHPGLLRGEGDLAGCRVAGAGDGCVSRHLSAGSGRRPRAGRQRRRLGERQGDSRKAFNPFLSRHDQIQGLRRTEVTERREESHVALP